MKQLLLLFVALQAIAAHSQSDDVKKYRAFQVYYYDNDEKPSYEEDIKWEEVNILVVVNSEKDNIRVFAKKEQQFDIIAKGKTTVDVDGDKTYKYSAVNSDGIKCTLEFVVFKSPETEHKATLIVRYKDYTFAYRLKDI